MEMRQPRLEINRREDSKEESTLAE